MSNEQHTAIAFILFVCLSKRVNSIVWVHESKTKEIRLQNLENSKEEKNCFWLAATIFGSTK